MTESTDKPYHHGDLPAALHRAAAELVAERGPSGFSLREVARRAGVSHAAPAHHFGDTRGLLTSLATEGLNLLADAMEEATAGIEDPSERMSACGKAYVRTSLAYPGHFGVAFKHDLCDATDEGYLTASLRAFGALQASVEYVRVHLNPELDADTFATVIWATVQGLVELAPSLGHVADRLGGGRTPLDQLIDWSTRTMLAGLVAQARVVSSGQRDG